MIAYLMRVIFLSNAVGEANMFSAQTFLIKYMNYLHKLDELSLPRVLTEANRQLAKSVSRQHT